MQKAWLTTFAAAASAVGISYTSALASPAGMAQPSQRPATSVATAHIAARTSVEPQAGAHVPSSAISPMRNPVKYLRSAIAEMPIGWKSKRGASTNPVAPPATQYNDAIALSTPTGPPTPQFFVTAAQLCERQGDIGQARQHYGQALSMWPGNVDVLRAAARMEDRVGDLALAENLYQQAVASNPQHAGALNDLGLCLARQGKLDASVQVIEQAIHLQPDKALYRNNAATVLVEMRQDQRALGHLVAVHGAADANYNLGQLLVQRGRAADATHYFQAALEQNPASEPARVELAKLQGRDPAVAGTTTTVPPTAPAPVAPVVAPAVVPQFAPPQQPPQAGPQFYYPPAAQSPAFGASSYVPPTYYRPPSSYPAAGTGTYGPATHRYLPPVASQPLPTRR